MGDTPEADDDPRGGGAGDRPLAVGLKSAWVAMVAAAAAGLLGQGCLAWKARLGPKQQDS